LIGHIIDKEICESPWWPADYAGCWLVGCQSTWVGFSLSADVGRSVWWLTCISRYSSLLTSHIRLCLLH